MKRGLRGVTIGRLEVTFIYTMGWGLYVDWNSTEPYRRWRLIAARHGWRPMWDPDHWQRKVCGFYLDFYPVGVE